MGKVEPLRRSKAIDQMREDIRIAMAKAIDSGSSLKDVEDELLEIFTRTRKIGHGG